MTSAQVRPAGATRPLVVVLCSVPLLGEAMSSALEFADIRSFAANGGDVGGLLVALRPDALIVDSLESAEAAATYAREHELPVVHVSPRNGTLHLLRRGEWEQVSAVEGPTPETIRNAVAGALFARERAVR